MPPTMPTEAVPALLRRVVGPEAVAAAWRACFEAGYAAGYGTACAHAAAVAAILAAATLLAFLARPRRSPPCDTRNS